MKKVDSMKMSIVSDQQGTIEQGRFGQNESIVTFVSTTTSVGFCMRAVDHLQAIL